MEVLTASWDWALGSGPLSPLVDVRSPEEFKDDHAPGAIASPLIDDDQRIIVGTLYAKAGSTEATAAGREMIRERIVPLVQSLAGFHPEGGRSIEVEALLAEFESIASAAIRGELEQVVVEKSLDAMSEDERAQALSASPPLFVYCWRGGLRSRSVALLLRKLGFPAVQLRGGYKAYRRLIMARVEALRVPPLAVLHGLTGAGKSRLLRMIAASRPELVLDLEDLAQHRSSILGDVGLEPRSARAFETALCLRFEEPFGPSVLVEGESRKVGSIVLPEPIWQRMQSGPQLELCVSERTRAERLAEEYVRPERLERIAAKIHWLVGRVPPRIGAPIREAWLAKDYVEVAHRLLRDYYDPRYRHAMKDIAICHRIEGEDLSAAAQEMLAWLETDMARWVAEQKTLKAPQ